VHRQSKINIVPASTSLILTECPFVTEITALASRSRTALLCGESFRKAKVKLYDAVVHNLDIARLQITMDRKERVAP
jgi:hypothetical protein